MSEFFHGWRRKAGCVTLVMACAFASVWIRSYDRFDFFEINHENRQHCLCSFAGNLVWRSWNTSWGKGSQFWQTIPADPTYAEKALNLKSELALAQETRCWVISDIWITIPLILLSAWLLFSKPRQPTPKSHELPEAIGA